MWKTDQAVLFRATAAVRLGRDIAETLAAEFGRLNMPTANAARRRLADGEPFAAEDQVVLEALLAATEAIVALETRGTRTAFAALSPVEDQDLGFSLVEVPIRSPRGETMAETADTLRRLLLLRRSVIDHFAAEAALRRLARP